MAGSVLSTGEGTSQGAAGPGFGRMEVTGTDAMARDVQVARTLLLIMIWACRQQQGASVSVGCKYKIAPISHSFQVPAMPFVPQQDGELGCRALTSTWTCGRFPWAMTQGFSSV